MQLIYSNQAGDSITLKQRKPYFLQRIDGTGSVKHIINTFKAPSQDGAFFISGTLDVRNITIEGTMVASSVDEAYALRNNLLCIFTPKQIGRLSYKGKEITCIVEEATVDKGTSEKLPAFFISLLCPSPFFEEAFDTRQELASWVDCFSFAMEIPSTGIEFGVREPSLIINVINTGDVSCGCVVEFKALGGVKNPELMNMETLERIKINKTMLAGEVITIATHFAAKRIKSNINDIVSNAFSFLDIDSTFIQITPGRNILRYNAEENLDLLEVSISYRPQYLGV